MQLPIFLDHNSTTPVDPRVLEVMLPFFSHTYGNAASRTHEFGWRAQEALEKARAQVAAAIGAFPEEIVFTSGATESDNLAILGAAEALRERGDHIVTSAIEHHAVLDPCRSLERRGFSITRVRPDSSGIIAAQAVAEAITPRTVLVSIMAANNEIGTLQPIGEIAARARATGALFHTDAAQAVGKMPLDVRKMGIDLLSISAHKIYGPKGIGALYVRRGNPPFKIEPLFFGGGHERGLRPGTPNVPGAVGLGAALAIAGTSSEEEAPRIRALRDRLHQGIIGKLEGVSLNGHPEERLPGSLNLSFAGLPGEALVMSLKGLAVSSGSACTSASVEPSYVLRAIGVPADLALASIRFGIGRFNTEEEIDHAAGRVVATVTELREMARAVGLARPPRGPVAPGAAGGYK
jgi:cysteine desulfurase